MTAAVATLPSGFDRRLGGLLLALVALFAFNVAVTPNFLDPQTLAVNVSQVSTIAIVALIFLGGQISDKLSTIGNSV